MSEILCFFTFPESNESNYFIIESTITLNQLQNFVLTSKIIDDSFTIETAANEPLTEENLAVLLAEAVHSDSPMPILFKRKAAIASEVPAPAAAPAVVEPVPEPKIEPIGPTMRSILDKIGVKLDESMLNDSQACLASLPFPYKFLFKQYLDQITKNPNILQTVVSQVAEMFSVDEQTLLAEVNVAVEFIKNPPAPKQPEAEIEIPPEPKVEEAAPECKEPLVGPILTQILKEHFGVEDSRLNSQEEIAKTISTLPFFNVLLGLGTRKARVAKFLAYGLANRFSVDNQKVKRELKQLAALLPSQPQNSTENQIPPFPGCRGFRRCHKGRLGQVNANVHPANCDGCKSMISGVRYYCLNCKNYDLCSACEQKNTDAPFHDESHIFAKIRDPTTPYKIDHLIYPNSQPNPCVFPSPPHVNNGPSVFPPHQRAHPHFRPHFNPCAFPPAPNAQESSQPGAEFPPHWWSKRFQNRAEASNRLDQLEASVKQLKETIAKLQKD